MAASDPASNRSGLIYCGLCGALNPAGNHFCAACGTTLVDAFHATEGLRVYERPDPASRLLEIIAAGSALDIVEDPDAPTDFLRVRLAQGRLGYIRLHDLDARELPAAPAGESPPDINTNARGCVSSTAAVASLLLLVVLLTLGLVLIYRSRVQDDDVGILTLVFCLIIVPFLLLTTGIYLYARGRDEGERSQESEVRSQE